MCTSVPQIALLATPISTSFGPGSGTGTSSIQSPGSARLHQRPHARCSSDHPQLAAGFGEGGHRRRDVLRPVRGRHLGADARLARGTTGNEKPMT